MTIWNFRQFRSLWVCGDIHGKFNKLMFEIKHLEIKNAVIIIAGDCGIGFEEQSYYTQLYNKMYPTLKVANNLLLLIRGNHDDPAFYDGITINFKRLKCIPDYSIVLAAERRILCVGGAISIDRTERKDRMKNNEFGNRKVPNIYWKGEAPVYNDQALCELCNLKIDTVITHTCPSFCYPICKYGIEKFSQKDEALLDDLQMERSVMDKIYNQLIANNHPIINWYFGHFHQSKTLLVNRILFTLLDSIEIKKV